MRDVIKKRTPVKTRYIEVSSRARKVLELRRKSRRVRRVEALEAFDMDWGELLLGDGVFERIGQR